MNVQLWWRSAFSGRKRFLAAALTITGVLAMASAYHMARVGAQTVATRFVGPTSSQPLALSADNSLLVVANHAAWFDPLWLAKVLPRFVTPMMTSAFFSTLSLSAEQN